MGPLTGRQVRRVDGINTFGCIRRSFHVLFALFRVVNTTFSQVKLLFAAGSIPGSSTENPPVRAKILASLLFQQYLINIRRLRSPITFSCNAIGMTAVRAPR